MLLSVHLLLASAAPYGSIHACSVTVQYREISGVEMEALNWISTHVRLASESCAAGSGPALHPLLIYRASRNNPPNDTLKGNEETSLATISGERSFLHLWFMVLLCPSSLAHILYIQIALVVIIFRDNDHGRLVVVQIASTVDHSGDERPSEFRLSHLLNRWNALILLTLDFCSTLANICRWWGRE